ncbi:MAG: 5'-nucleotidase C-terminal domain-containing protein [Bacteroidales bacterium]|nr:5'-nucleotidase C-terminal domain-containing protein [Bacteroidales bacterium]
MKTPILTLILVILFSVTYSQKLVILHTNDMHSKLTAFGPEKSYTPLTPNDDNTIGGFARLSTLIANEKKINADAVLVCDAGDFLMGTIFQSLEPETGFELNLMKAIGYDVITLGNHEFDFGAYPLGKTIKNAKLNGAIPQIVASQLQFSQTDTIDDLLESFFTNKTIKPYTVIEKNGLKIGFFGILGQEAQSVTQAARPIIFSDRFKTAKTIVKTLRDIENVDIIICLSHSGVIPNDDGIMIGEDIELAKKVSDIDIIISGHTHVPTHKYIQQGKTIIVQTGSYLKNVGRLEINFDNGNISVTNFKLIKMTDSIVGDANVTSKINDQITLLNKAFFQPLGYNYSEAIAETNFKVSKGSYILHTPGSLGNLITDAIMYYSNTYGDSTDIVMGAQGTIREDILAGEISPADIFRVSPLGFGKNDLLGYSLAKIYVTANELKKLMELAIFASKPGEDSYLYFSGIQAFYNPKGGFLNKVKMIKVNGQEIDFSKKNKKLYSVVSNSYLLGFVSEIKKMSKGLIVIRPKNSEGELINSPIDHLIDYDKTKNGIQEGKEWIAVIEYLKQFSDINNNGIPDIPTKYDIFVSPFIKISK